MTATMTFRAVLTAALVALPFAGFAQETEDTVLNPGETADSGGANYVAATFTDWDVRCLRVEEGQPEPCTLYQLIGDGNGNPVAEINLFPLNDGSPAVAGASIITPLDTLLTPGLRLRVDDGAWSEYPFAFCRPIGCFARLGFTQEEVDAFKAGGAAFIGIVPLQAPDQLIQLEMSLSGFTAAFDDLVARVESGAAAEQ